MTDKEQRAEYIFITILSCFFLSITGLMWWSKWFSELAMIIDYVGTGVILSCLLLRFLIVWTSLPPRPKF